MSYLDLLKQDTEKTVRWALEEDIRSGDITAELIPSNQSSKATIITRENAVICGVSWVNEVFRQVDGSVTIDWHVNDGDLIVPNQVLCHLEGSAASILTGERCALNFLQTLSGTATKSHEYAQLVKHTKVELLDTRKTLPGLRTAQKYAVSCGGCSNHRVGLYDAYLIKENHIQACGGITAAVKTAKHLHPGKPVEVEVENFEELREAMDAGCDTVMLDNFDTEQTRQAVNITRDKVKLEASGGIDKQSLVEKAETGVDYISIGALTKSCQALDLSLRLTE
ncbi:MAG: carboxylating nicotinate-nucleotide diphosphorylase [Gammaproteobacteria bacterium]|nr:carboxylating nicotinate-nucleotide diphosphorylase [Gammaproteobacteria bacterium]